jgi:hypothetical protein
VFGEAKMSSMSGHVSDRSTAYLGFSKFPCYCDEPADLWRSGTSENPGRLFLKCGMEKVSGVEVFGSALFLFFCFLPIIFFCLSILMFTQRCKYWFWEDEVSARSNRSQNVRKGLDSTNPSRLFSSSKVLQGIKDVQSELLLVRIVLIALVVAVGWIASRV